MSFLNWFCLSSRMCVLLATVILGEYANATIRPFRSASGTRRAARLAYRMFLYLALGIFLMLKIPPARWASPMTYPDIVVYALALFSATRGIVAIRVARRAKPQDEEA